MNVKKRVRGVLITPAGDMLLIKRARPGSEPYWVFPGGGLEESDRDEEEALHREVQEELNGEIEVLKLVYILERQLSDSLERELFYLCNVAVWSEEDRTGPEFSEVGRGTYDLEEVPIRKEVLEAMSIKPDAARDFLAMNANNLTDLPDLREEK